MTYLSEQFTRLKNNGYDRKHFITVWANTDGSFEASVDQHGGYVTEKKHATPEAAIEHAMVCAEQGFK